MWDSQLYVSWHVGLQFSIFDYFCQKIIFTFTNSVDPNEMQHYAAFHQGLHGLQKHSSSGLPNPKG